MLSERHHQPFRDIELGLDNGKNRVVEKYNIKIDKNISIGGIPEELYEYTKLGADVYSVSAIKIERIEH